jgi:hypothetical protein
MGETANIGEMAVLASAEIFNVFGWMQVGPTDENSECVEKEKHHKVKSTWKKHPTDAVYKYIDPYRGIDVYINTDLKSYAAGTLETTDLVKTLKSLGHATECANKSQEWKRMYVDETRNHEVVGLLFVYNHDGDYEKDFNDQLVQINPSQLQLSPGYFVGVIGPLRVVYLNSIAKDIKSLHSDEKLPGKEDRFFFFPHLNRSAALHQTSQSVGLPFLLGPLIVLGYDFSDKPRSQARGYCVYYDGAGETIEEFKYVFDYLFRYQIAGEGTDISINLVFPSPDAHPTSEKAKLEFARDHWPVANSSQDEVRSILKHITFRQVQNVVQRFSSKSIGMGSRTKGE